MTGNKRLKLFVFFIYSLLLPVVFAQNVWNGVIHMRDDINLDKEIFFLDGLWEYYPGQQFSTFNREKYDMTFINVPSDWNKSAKNSIHSDYACYRIKIMGLNPRKTYAFISRETPSTACRFYCNGNLVKSYGNYSIEKNYDIPAEKLLYFTVTPDSIGSIEFVVQVSNYVSNKSGILAPIGFTSEPRALVRIRHVMGWICFLIGIVIVNLSVTISINFGNKNRKIHLVFGLLLIGILLRAIIADGNFLDLIFPLLPYEISKRLENLCIWLSGILYYWIMGTDKSYNSKLKIVDKVYLYYFIAVGILMLALPVRYSGSIILYAHISAGLYGGYCLYRAFRSFNQGHTKQGLQMVFFPIVETGILLDYFFNAQILSSFVTATQVSVVLLQFINIVALAFSHQEIFRKKGETLNELAVKNETYSRLVSKEFLALVSKKAPEDVNLGDYSEEKMAIMYLQLYPVIAPGKKLSPKTEFELYNEFMIGICDCVKENQGFITNFTGSGCMALFPKDVNDAIRASKYIEYMTSILNENHENADGVVIKISGGIHYGYMIFGIVGEERRMENTVISDTVNTACRINAVAYKIGEPFLISQTAIDEIKDSSVFEMQRFGNTVLKGKGNLLTLYKIKDTDKESDESEDKTVSITQEEIDQIVKNLW